MLIDQLSVFIENSQGRMAQITKLLAEGGIDIRALSIADTADFGILRLIVNRPSEAREILARSNITVSITKVLAVALPDVPGGLHKAVQVLADAGIIIEYMYAFLNPKKDTAFVIIRVENNEYAAQVLKSGGIEFMSEEDIYQM